MKKHGEGLIILVRKVGGVVLYLHNVFSSRFLSRASDLDFSIFARKAREELKGKLVELGYFADIDIKSLINMKSTRQIEYKE
jgi:hypothetical protein